MTIHSPEKTRRGDHTADTFVKSARGCVIFARREPNFLHPAITIAA